MSLEQTLQHAIQHHQAGRAEPARQAYQQVLSADPAHAQALYLLGALEHQQRNFAAAIVHLQRATQLRPDSAPAFYFLGSSLASAERETEGAAALRQALALKPDWTQARFELAVLLHKLGEIEEAIALYIRVLADEPNHLQALSNLGVAHQTNNRFDRAVEVLERAAALAPRSAPILNNFGNALKNNGELDRAIDVLKMAVQFGSDSYETHYSLANAMLLRGQRLPAISEYEAALRLAPDRLETRQGLADALVRLAVQEMKADRQRAMQRLERALSVWPDHALALNALATDAMKRGDFDAAEAHYRTAIAAAPEDARILLNYGALLKDQGHVADAIAYFRRSAAIDPSNHAAHSNLLYTLHFDPQTTPQQLIDAHRAWDAAHARPLAPGRRAFDNDPDPDRPLRIGYVSADFRDHVVGWNFLPLIRHHDRRQFLPHCFMDQSGPGDEVTDEIERHLHGATHFGPTFSDDVLAELIQRHQIDILVDLTLHMNGNRLLCFARRPAPVQCTFIGYPGTTGLSAMDYRLTDPYLDPAGENDAYYVEKSVRLPNTFWCFDPMGHEPPISPLPVSRNGCLTFGCLSNYCKINEGVLALWSRVLGALGDSRLMLLTHPGQHRQRVLGVLERLGVHPDRVQFAAPRPRGAFLELFNDIDLCLDTFPYNGHSTSLDAMWMGVPTVTLAGTLAVGRAGASQLNNVGLSNLIAASADEFVQIATTLASDAERLGEIRATLRQRMRSSPLMDAAAFARNVEAAYRQMWRRYCAGERRAGS
jgi:predicted O-linked N-acetylglucosamine transferase (SPINDLY family)